MKKTNSTIKKTIITLLMLSIFLIAGCEFFFESEDVLKAAKTGDPDECKKLDISEDDGKIERCLTRMATDTGKGEICHEIIDITKQNRCFTEVAEKTGEDKYCSSIDAGDKDDCYSKAAITSGEVSSCQKIKDRSKIQSCYNYLATKHNKVEVCKMLTNDDTLAKCIRTIATDQKDHTICKELSAIRQDFCITEVAVAAGKATLCNELSNAQKECFIKVATAKDEPTLCERAYTNDLEYDQCVMKIATKYRNYKDCSFLKVEHNKNSCFKDIGISTKDCSICDNIVNDKEKKAICLESCS